MKYLLKIQDHCGLNLKNSMLGVSIFSKSEFKLFLKTSTYLPLKSLLVLDFMVFFLLYGFLRHNEQIISPIASLVLEFKLLYKILSASVLISLLTPRILFRNLKHSAHFLAIGGISSKSSTAQHNSDAL